MKVYSYAQSWTTDVWEIDELEMSEEEYAHEITKSMSPMSRLLFKTEKSLFEWIIRCAECRLKSLAREVYISEYTITEYKNKIKGL